MACQIRLWDANSKYHLVNNFASSTVSYLWYAYHPLNLLEKFQVDFSDLAKGYPCLQTA